MRKASQFFFNYNIGIFEVWNFNETLTNNVISFEQPGPDLGALLFLGILV